MTTLRQRTAELLQANRPDDPAGRLVDTFLIGLIMANVVMIILETVPALREEHARLFWHFEVFSVLVFTAEYFLRLWSCIDREHAKSRHPVLGRLRWMLSPLGLIDLLAILPFWIFLLFPTEPGALLLLRVFRGVRLLRIFKLTRYSPALAVMRSVVRRESGTLVVAGAMLTVILVMSSWGIYVLEREQQPEVFGTMPEAMWWSIITLTTVGYGDVVPMTVWGKILASFISLVGIGMVAMPAGILASGFSAAVRDRNTEYSAALRQAVEDGAISEQEAERLERLREELGISQEEARHLLLQAQLHPGTAQRCPHCGESLFSSVADESSSS